MKFKTDRLQEEFTIVNQAVRDILIYADLFCKLAFKKRITVTCLLRTDAEQDAIYKNNAVYKITPFKSPHQFGTAADISVKGFTDAEILNLMFVLTAIPYRTPGKKSAIRHDVGAGDHIHLQV